MQNSIGEEGVNFLTDSAFENGAQVTSMKAGTSNKRDATSLTLLISGVKQVASRLLEAPAFMLVTCAPFSKAESVKKFTPSSPIEFFTC